MRTHGTLKRWNDDRGFGFILPANSDAEIFVHISAYPRDGLRPKLDELISYETETGQGGKLRAVRIMRASQKTSSRHSKVARRSNRPSGAVGAILGIVAIAAVGGFVYSRLHDPALVVESSPRVLAVPAPPSANRCDGRTRCSEMTSCAEARYFLQNCPGTKMDGNRDGEPCEQQWCN